MKQSYKNQTENINKYRLANEIVIGEKRKKILLISIKVFLHSIFVSVYIIYKTENFKKNVNSNLNFIKYFRNMFEFIDILTTKNDDI